MIAPVMTNERRHMRRCKRRLQGFGLGKRSRHRLFDQRGPAAPGGLQPHLTVQGRRHRQNCPIDGDINRLQRCKPWHGSGHRNSRIRINDARKRCARMGLNRGHMPPANQPAPHHKDAGHITAPICHGTNS